MQKALNAYSGEGSGYVKFQALCKLLKQWRTKQDLCHRLYPEVLDSILLHVVNRLLAQQTKPSTKEDL